MNPDSLAELESSVAYTLKKTAERRGSSADLYHAWRKQGSPSGGSDALWNTELQHRIFTEMLQGFFSPSELEAQWRVIRSSASA